MYIIFSISARRGFIVSMYVIFLGIVPLMALCALLSFYYRQNPVLFKRKITSTKLSYVPNKQKIVEFFTCTCLFHTHKTNEIQSETSPTCFNRFFHSKDDKNVADDVKSSSSGLKNIEIKTAGLVSTTNPLILNRNSESKIFTIPRTSFQDKISYFNHK